MVQGIGAAAPSPASLALHAAAYPAPQERVKAIGLWAGFSGIGLAAGPLAGGILVDAFGWPAIFLVNVPIGAILLLVGMRVLSESRNPNAPAIDLPGTVLNVLGVGALTFGLIEGGSRGWTSPVIPGTLAAAVAILAVFVVVERRGATPMLPLRLFTVSNTAMVVVGFALMGSSFFFSQFFVHANTGYGNVWWRLAIVGVGFALTMSPLTGAAIQAVSPQENGLASGISSTTRQIGAVLGVAVLGAVVRTREVGGASFESGLDSAFVAAGVVTLDGAVFTGLWLVRSRPAEVSAPQAPTVTTPSG
ncbi:MFS transporter [Nonomuraea sp. NPDC003201]